MRGKLQPEIYLLFKAGHKPKDLIEIGYNKKTVYNYSARMPQILMAYKGALRQIKFNKKKENSV
jgi:hypothetical protein